MIFDAFEVNYMKITQVTFHELQGFGLEVQMLFLMSFPSTPQSLKSRAGALSLMGFPTFIQICYNYFPKSMTRNRTSSESTSKTWTNGIFSGEKI